LSEARSYSGRSSSALSVARFLVGMGFRFRSPPGTDDPNKLVAPVGMSQKQNSTLARRPDRDESLLRKRVIRAIERERGGIGEHGRALGEGDLVLLEIGRRLLGTLLVDHDLSLRPSESKSMAWTAQRYE